MRPMPHQCVSYAFGAWNGITGQLWLGRGCARREPRGGVLVVVGGGVGGPVRCRGAPQEGVVCDVSICRVYVKRMTSYAQEWSGDSLGVLVGC